MRLLKFNHSEIDFVVQSFLQNDFANICELNGDSFRIDFKNSTVSTCNKESRLWIEKCKKLNLKEIHQILVGLAKK